MTRIQFTAKCTYCQGKVTVNLRDAELTRFLMSKDENIVRMIVERHLCWLN
jgi:hypothetical protein